MTRIHPLLPQDVARIRFLPEGKCFNAYLGLPGGAYKGVLVGSVAIAILNYPERKQAFVDLMTGLIVDLTKDNLGFAPAARTASAEPECDAR